MKAILILMTAILWWGQISFAKDFEVAKDPQSGAWHLHIQSNTDVYGEFPVSGSLSVDEEVSGELTFHLKETKSYELVEKGEKETSDARDARIYSITGAKKQDPKFQITSVEGFHPKKESDVKIQGNLTLNGISKDIVIEGHVTPADGGYLFKGEYSLAWNDFKITNPIMWFMRVAKKADPHINLKFNLRFQAR